MKNVRRKKVKNFLRLGMFFATFENFAIFFLFFCQQTARKLKLYVGF